MIHKLYAISSGLSKRFPNGNSPFQIMTRLLEECGELAEQVNHFEDIGVKRDKHGESDRAHLAKEVRDVLLCTLQIAQYYHVEAELEGLVELAVQRMKNEGLIPIQNSP